MINLGTTREVFFDDFLIDTDKSTTDLLLHKPIPKEIVMSFDKEWEGNSSYVHLFKDDGIYKMYYIAWSKNKLFSDISEEDDKKLRCCYAESTDGLNWTKPDLGIYEWKGNKHNNIVFMAEWLDNFYVFKDTNPNCPPDKKYKAIVRNDSNERHGISAYFSADGIHFVPGSFITRQGAFDTLNIIFWDENAKKYRGYIRSFHDIPIKGGGDYMDYLRHFETGEKMEVIAGHNTDDTGKLGAGVLNLGKRDIRYIESNDFVTWSNPVRLDFGDKEDIPLYTNCVTQYERAPHMFIGFPTRYTERKEWSKSFDVLCGKEERLRKMEIWAKRMGLAITDCLFMCSRDGVNFTRYDEAFFRNGPENGRNWIYGDAYPAKGFVQTRSDFEGADDEFSMFCPEMSKEKYEVLRRYTIRTDGFVSVHAGAETKVLVTKTFTFEGDKLFANISTSACGYIYFEISDKNGNVLTSCEMFGDSTDKPVGFENSLSEFAGKEVVMTVRMRDADLYSIQFSKE